MKNYLINWLLGDNSAHINTHTFHIKKYKTRKCNKKYFMNKTQYKICKESRNGSEKTSHSRVTAFY